MHSLATLSWETLSYLAFFIFVIPAAYASRSVSVQVKCVLATAADIGERECIVIAIESSSHVM